MKKIIILFLFAGSIFLLHACGNQSKSTEVVLVPPSVKQIDQPAFEALVKKDHPVIVDVRTSAEIAEGIIPGATVFANVNEEAFDAEISKLDTTKSYIVYCRSGARSNKAANIMISKGFKNVYNLAGGVLNWKGAMIKP
ncbi:MAG: rhodanese-like domain-containing protein [Ferruginibacter sp.]